MRKIPVPVSPLTFIPEIGSMTTLTFRETSAVLTGPLAHLCKATWDLVGKIAFKPAWDKNPDNIAVFVENSPVPMRIVNINLLVAVDGKPVLQSGKPKFERKEWRIPGSKGGEYIVSCTDKDWACTCPGFNFRHTCKHIETTRSKNEK